MLRNRQRQLVCRLAVPIPAAVAAASITTPIAATTVATAAIAAAIATALATTALAAALAAARAAHRVQGRAQLPRFVAPEVKQWRLSGAQLGLGLRARVQRPRDRCRWVPRGRAHLRLLRPGRLQQLPRVGVQRRWVLRRLAQHCRGRVPHLLRRVPALTATATATLTTAVATAAIAATNATANAAFAAAAPPALSHRSI